MKLYKVTLTLVDVVKVIVSAESKDDARRKAMDIDDPLDSGVHHDSYRECPDLDIHVTEIEGGN